MKREERYQRILDYFRSTNPHVTTELHFGSVFQLLVATMLSAQCTDKRVNLVTPDLFATFPTAKAMADADESEIYELIKSVSYPNAKARHLREMANMIVGKFKGDVAYSFEDLVSLPVVGRKTANVIEAVAYQKASMPVDTHVFRVSHRLGLVSKSAKIPYLVEQQLKKNIPQNDIANAHHWLILHGRYICKSRKPQCYICPFDDFCPKNI